MQVTAYKTPKIKANDDLYKILDECLPKLEEASIVSITSKIIALCQGDVIKNDGTVDKRALIKQEADWYIEDPNLDQFGTLIITIKEDILIANAGIDESNADGYFVLWPKNIQTTIIKVWNYLKQKHSVENLGIIFTDSRLTPLRWGLQGVGIAWCGFSAINDYVGKPDIFGRELKMSKESILDGLSAASVVLMGEGNEQTPLVVIQDVPFVQFQDHPPTEKEKQDMRIKKEEDIYGKLLNSVKWQKGGK
ncbi:MAG TPA: coenzyme F420-0:L-glutamate ligase [Candidatus Saccharimonadales bacterium]|nr:coenzyme F420-0:L-glutamate ligase [Candidatus Saccharimonadales bacterium]